MTETYQPVIRLLDELVMEATWGTPTIWSERPWSGSGTW
jgi:hypothetical protein